ncbi:MAG: hypothetical protein NTY15_21090 [Planctomycetota bacterium]|nr:hypothetical protein [Planctomycetota bacterium]
MKFTGLILICASSCLALILPAIGVVQFPKTLQSQSSVMQATTFSTSTPVSAPNFPNSPQWTQASPQRDFLPDSLNSAPSPFPTQQSLTVAPVAPIQEATLNSPDGRSPAGQKFGMGVWLLLAPVCLIGLAMWTFSPNPSGTKKVA